MVRGPAIKPLVLSAYSVLSRLEMVYVLTYICSDLVQGAIYNWLFGRFFVWFILAIYFDNVLPDVNGVRKPFFYFVWPSYWTGRARNASEDWSGFLVASLCSNQIKQQRQKLGCATSKEQACRWWMLLVH